MALLDSDAGIANGEREHTTEHVELGEVVAAAHNAFLQARNDLEKVIGEVVVLIDSHAEVDIGAVRQQVIEAYRSLSGQNYFPHQVITRPSKRGLLDDPGQQG